MRLRFGCVFHKPLKPDADHAAGGKMRTIYRYRITSHSITEKSVPNTIFFIKAQSFCRYPFCDNHFINFIASLLFTLRIILIKFIRSQNRFFLIYIINFIYLNHNMNPISIYLMLKIS